MLKMKTYHFVLFALNLLGTLDASSRKGGNTGRSRRITRTTVISNTYSGDNTDTGYDSSSEPVHILLMPEYNMHFGQQAKSDKSTEKFYHDEENKSSELMSDSKVSTSKPCKRKATKKRAEFRYDNFDESDAADALISMSKSGGDSEIDLEDYKPRNKRERKEKVFLPLKEITDQMLLNDKIRNYSVYFDESNMSSVGSEILFKCMSDSKSPKLATYLIKHGARLADNEESAIIALIAKEEEEEGIRTQLFRVLLEEDPISVAKIFSRAAGMTESADETVDMFFFVLLFEVTEILSETQIDLLMSLIEILSGSDRMSNSLSLLFGDRNRIISLLLRALKSGNANFIEILLERGLIDMNEMIPVSVSVVQTLTSALFGRIESNKILDFIKRFNYDMKTANNSLINPDGDILLSALTIKDVKSFKKLLLLGASLNVRFGDENQVGLEESVRVNHVDFYEAIQSFKRGTLKAEIDAEEAEEIDAPDAMLVAPTGTF